MSKSAITTITTSRTALRVVREFDLPRRAGIHATHKKGEEMSDNLLQRSVTTSVARNLANTTKTSPKMMSITPRWLLSMLPWLHVEGGTYRVNRTKVELTKAERIGVDLRDGAYSFAPESVRSVPLFAKLPEALIARMAKAFKQEDVSLGNKLIVEGEDLSKFFIIAQGQ